MSSAATSANAPDPLRPGMAWLAHAVLWLGIAVTAFPLYIAFVASTLTAPDVAQAPMPILPGPHGLDTYRTILLQGLQGTYLSPPVWQMMWNSLLMALIITAGKVVLCLLWALALVVLGIVPYWIWQSRAMGLRQMKSWNASRAARCQVTPSSSCA